MQETISYIPQPKPNKSSSSRLGILPKIFSIRLLLVVVILLQIVLVGLSINPPYVYNLNTTKQIVDEVSRLTTINTLETPYISSISDIDTLKKTNSVSAQVYKDAQNGDYVLVFSDKMVIYRRNDRKIVYDGDSPGTIVSKTQTALQTAVVKKVTDGKLVTDTTDTPQLSIVTDATAVQKQDAKFYANAAKDDVIAIFPISNVIVLYRPATDTIINSGSIKTTITTR